MGDTYKSPDNPRRRTMVLLAVVLATSAVWPASAQTGSGGDQPVTAKITLGPREGAAYPTRHGQSLTGGGNIDVSQPAPDTLVIRMSGNVAACGNLLVGADAALNFSQDIQFLVEFSQPGHPGKLVVEATVNGLLSGKGKHSAVGMDNAIVSIACGPNEIASLPMASRAVGGGESFALNSSQGPICVPIYQGCYSLRQDFRIFATQKGGVSCGKAIAEFSPSPLSTSWIGSSYPFQQVDKQGLGYQVTLRVVPDPLGN